MVIAPARRAGDPGSNYGPGENFSIKLLLYDLPDGYSESPVDRLSGLVVIAPARRSGDPGSNPGPGENFFILNY